MYYGYPEGYTDIEKVLGDSVCNALCCSAKRVSWINSCVSGDVAVEFRIWGVLCHQCIPGVGIECACRHLVRAEKHWKIRISKGVEHFKHRNTTSQDT